MRFFEIIKETNDALLWHGIRDYSHAVTALRNNAMLGTTTQRWWPDDRHYTDDQGDLYNNSYWMKGLSLTRDRKYAEAWGSVVFALDKTKIRQNFKVVPFSWQKTFAPNRSHPIHYKREREEFVILEKEPKTYTIPGDELPPGHRPMLDMEEFLKPAERSLSPLNKFLVGIWTEGFKEKPSEFSEIEQHPMWKGHYFVPGRSNSIGLVT